MYVYACMCMCIIINCSDYFRSTFYPVYHALSLYFYCMRKTVPLSWVNHIMRHVSDDIKNVKQTKDFVFCFSIEVVLG